VVPQVLLAGDGRPAWDASLPNVFLVIVLARLTGSLLVSVALGVAFVAALRALV
jgi:branched-subunit amino acid transport protein